MLTHYKTHRRTHSNFTVDSYSTPVLRTYHSASNLCLSGMPPQPEKNLEETLAWATTFCETKKVNALIAEDAQAEMYARDALITKLVTERGKARASEYSDYVAALNLSPISICMVMATPGIQNEIRKKLCEKLLLIDAAEFYILDKVFTLHELIKNVKPNDIKTRLKAQITAKFIAGQTQAHVIPLIYLVEKYTNDPRACATVVKFYLEKFELAAKKAKREVFIEHEADEHGNNYLHQLLAKDDTQLPKVYDFLDLIFKQDTELQIAYSNYFASALIAKNHAGLTPLEMYEEKSAGWEGVMQSYMARLSLLLVNMIHLSDAEWDTVFANKHDVYGNTRAKNKIASMFAEKEYKEMDRLIGERVATRAEIAHLSITAITKKIENGESYDVELMRKLSVRMRQMFGQNEYCDIVYTNGRSLSFMVNMLASNTAFKISNDQEQEAPKNGLDLIKIVSESYAYWNAMHLSSVTDTFMWDAVRRSCSGEIVDARLGKYLAALKKQQKLYQIDMDHCVNGRTPLYVAAFEVRSPYLVKFLCANFNIIIKPEYLLIAGNHGDLLANNIFAYLVTQYNLAAEKDRTLPAINSIVDAAGVDLIYRTVVAFPNIAATELLLQNGCNATRVYGDNKDSILIQLLHKVLKCKMPAETGLQLMQILLRDDARAKIILNKKNKNSLTALSFLLSVIQQIDDQIVIGILNLFLDKGACCLQIDGNVNILHLAISCSSIEVYKFLLAKLQAILKPQEFISLLNGVNDRKYTPLDIAESLHQHVSCVTQEDAYKDAAVILANKIAILKEYGAKQFKELNPAPVQSRLVYKGA